MDIPILIQKREGSRYGVTVPDIPGCVTTGETVDKAMSNATKAIYGHVGIWSSRASRSRSNRPKWSTCRASPTTPTASGPWSASTWPGWMIRRKADRRFAAKTAGTYDLNRWLHCSNRSNAQYGP